MFTYTPRIIYLVRSGRTRHRDTARHEGYIGPKTQGHKKNTSDTADTRDRKDTNDNGHQVKRLAIYHRRHRTMDIRVFSCIYIQHSL